MILQLHITAGALALVFGYVALLSAKGATVHRKAGMLFVYAMMTMALSGALIAAMSGTSTSVIAGLLTFYFVLTGVLTLRRSSKPRWIDMAGVAVAIVVGVLAFGAGRDMLARGRPEAFPLFLFGALAMLGAIGDTRMIRAGGIQGPRRLARHLWRMCFAMWVAAASFFWGPAGRVPDIINIPALLPIPVLLPIAVMVYWLWRIRVKKASQNNVKLGARAEAVS